MVFLTHGRPEVFTDLGIVMIQRRNGISKTLVDGRAFATPQDIKAIAPDVLRHRLSPSYEAEAEGLDANALVGRLLEHVVVP